MKKRNSKTKQPAKRNSQEKTGKDLQVGEETLRVLDADDLSDVAGGNTIPSMACTYDNI